MQGRFRKEWGWGGRRWAGSLSMVETAKQSPRKPLSALSLIRTSQELGYFFIAQIALISQKASNAQVQRSVTRTALSEVFQSYDGLESRCDTVHQSPI